MVRALLAALLVGLLGCAPTPPAHPGDYHGSDADVTVTRLGHAGLLLTIEGKHFLVDPWLHETTFVHQGEPLGLRPSGFPAVTAVLLTDDDSARIDETALTELAHTVPQAVGPPAVGKRLTADGFRQVSELKPWQEVTIDGVGVTAVPARGNGYVLRSGETVVYVAGEDTDAAEAAEIRRVAGPIDVAVLPIGGPRRFGMRAGTAPEEAADAAAKLDARRVVPSAYGARGLFPFVTFRRDAVARFRQAATAAGIAPGTVIVLETGESWHYYR
jgi:L-ascorbate metabolism protein UlaG (beta-lactamase superfamily)